MAEPQPRRRIPLRAWQGPGGQSDLKISSVRQTDSSDSDDEVDVDKLDGDLRIKRLELDAELWRSMLGFNDLPSMMNLPRRVLVTHIEDPTNVYIKLMDMESDVLKDFQAHCENSPNKKLQYDPLMDKETYAWKDMQENKWKRVRVVGCGRNPKDRLCLAFDIDSGTTHQVGYDELYHLSYKYAKISGQVYRTFLLDVGPLNDTNNSITTNLMRELALGKEFLGLALTTKVLNSDEPVPWQYRICCGVYLYKVHSISLNAELCHRKVFDAFGPMGGYPGFLDNDLAEKIIQVESWSKPSEFTLTKLREQFASTGFRITDSSMPSCNAPSIAYPRHPLARDTAEGKLVWDKIPNEIQGRLAVGLITNFVSPGCFYIQMYDKLPLYYAMIRLLEQMLVISKKVPINQLKVGDLVAIRIEDIKGKEQLYRAVVKHKTEGTWSNVIHVLLIDFGYSLCIRSNAQQIQLLPEKFEKIVPFCYRVHLDTIRSIKSLVISDKESPTDKWPWPADAIDSSKNFLGDAIKWDKAFIELKCFFWKPRNASVCQLAEFDQEVEYDNTNKTWLPVPISFEKQKYNEKDKYLNENKFKLFLAQLFVSIGIDFGVDVVGEKRHDPNNPHCSYRLSRLSRELVKERFAVPTE